MESTTIFLKHTDKKGNSYAYDHRVWDRDLFLESELDAARKEGGTIEVLTEREYQKTRTRVAK